MFFNIYFLQRLYNVGARKMVLGGTGPLGCIPSQLYMVNGNNNNNNNNNNSKCVTKINNLVSLFNSRLKDLPNTLNTTLPGSFFIYQNIYDLFHDMVVNPSRYGKMTTTYLFNKGFAFNLNI